MCSSGTIYVHTNTLNGKVYVGQTWQESTDRWVTQRNAAMRGAAGCRHFYSAIRKHGWAAFDHAVVGAANTQDDMDNLEKVWIIALRANDRRFGYNLASGGSRGVYVSDETRQRMSLAAKARKRGPCPEETKAKIAAAQIGISKPVSFATKEARKTNPKVLANCRAMGAMHKGKSWSEARLAAQEKRANRPYRSAGRKTGRPAWNKGIKMPSVSARMMGNANGRFSWKNKKQEASIV